MHREKSPYSVHAVEKAIEILEILTEDHVAPTLPYLAETLDLSRNRVFRLMATLEEKGLVEKEESSGCYRLGLPAVELAQKVLKSFDSLPKESWLSADFIIFCLVKRVYR